MNKKIMDMELLYSSPLPSTRTGIFYNAFSYPTKISPESIAVYIATHTLPGETVLDVFGGSGSTGLAALMCENPTEQMLRIAQDMGLNPIWGVRNAILYELGKYGAFASEVMCNPPDASEFRKVAEEFIKVAKEELGWIYNTTDQHGEIGEIRHIVWSDILICPKCAENAKYFDIAIGYEPIKILKECKCPKCGYIGNIELYSHELENSFDEILNKSITRKKRVPVLIYGQTRKKKWAKLPEESDFLVLKKIDEMKFESESEAKEIVWGELYRSGYHTGITHLHHFYTKRNFHVMRVLWQLTEKFSGKIQNALKLLLLSYNSSHSTLMSRVVVKKNSKDFVLTGAQSGVLYISSLPVEKNIIKGIERKLSNFIEVFKFINNCHGKVEIINSSSEQIDIETESIDYVFTDPPFGDYIPYAEVNQINELWLGQITDRKAELIISNSQKKDVACYGDMMRNVFSEINRVIKKGSNATVVFHSSKVDVWKAFYGAIASSNFMVQQTSSLNKTQSSFKQTVSEGSVQGDPVILLSKGEATIGSDVSFSILDEIIKQLSIIGDNNVRVIFSKYLTTCLEKGATINLSAKEVYSYANLKMEECKNALL